MNLEDKAIKKQKRSRYIWILLAAVLVFMGGCDSLKDVKSSTIHVDKKEKVTSVIVEDFSKAYYDKDELKESIEKAIESYNKAGSKQPVSLKDFTVKKGQARIVMKYDTCADYQAFNQTILYSGTVAGAEKEGYEFKTGFLDTSGAAVDAAAVLSANPNARVIISNEPVSIKTTKNILYVSENVSIQDEKTAKISATGNQDNGNSQISIAGYAYVIYQS